MSFEGQKKKISVPCEKHLQKEIVKKRRSKMFFDQENSFTENNPTDIEDIDDLKGNFSGVIKGNLFGEMNSQQMWSDNRSQLSQGSIFNANPSQGYDNPLLTNLLNELECESYDNYKTKPKTQQPISSSLLQKTKGKKMDFSQKFANDSNDSMQWETFQSKRSQI